MTEQPQQAGEPYDPREREPQTDGDGGGGEAGTSFAGEPLNAPEPDVDKKPGADYG